jgi:CRISPR-associated protein (TIGR02584 family)
MLSGSSPIRNILIAVAGRTPAIITETLWTLEQNRGVELDEIRVITTAEGKRSAISELLADGGAFGSYCKDYSIPAGRIAFSEKNIYVLRDAHGRELEDIRSSEDNRQTADQVFSLLREWTKRKNEVPYCSVPGGRSNRLRALKK